jgi:isoquinoline 1-oxidoreductase alpha subunit
MRASAAIASRARSWPRWRCSRKKGSHITDADLDEVRNICGCGTYSRIREAIRAAAAQM